VDKKAGLSVAERQILLENLELEVRQQLQVLPILVRAQVMPIMAPVVEILGELIKQSEATNRLIAGHVEGLGYMICDKGVKNGNGQN
jgi:hypothetical protein